MSKNTQRTGDGPSGKELTDEAGPHAVGGALLLAAGDAHGAATRTGLALSHGEPVPEEAVASLEEEAERLKRLAERARSTAASE